MPGFLRVYDYRYFDSEGTPRFPPNLDGWHRSYDGRPDVKIHINSEGFRGEEPLSHPSSRIVMVGDSTLFNGGVDLKESFPSLLEDRLRKHARDPNIEVLNFGVSDTNAHQYLLKVKNHAIDYHPNLIVVLLYLNDAMDTPLTSFDTSSRGLHVPWYHSFAVDKLSSLIRGIYILLKAKTSGRFEWVERFQSRKYLDGSSEWRRMVEEARFDWGSAWSENAWKGIESSIGELVNITRERNVETWLVVLPVMPQIILPDSAAELYRPQLYAKEMARRLNMKLLDPLEFLRSSKNREDLYYDQCHFTAEGNQVLADFLAPQFERWESEKVSRANGDGFIR